LKTQSLLEHSRLKKNINRALKTHSHAHLEMNSMLASIIFAALTLANLAVAAPGHWNWPFYEEP